MATGPSYLEKKSLGATRSGASQSAAAPPSPHTPQRNPPSTFSSPGGGLRSEEEFAIFEIGARHISAGYAGDSRPKCTLYFNKEESRRVGDFRHWLPGYERLGGLTKAASEWSSDCELWQLDLRHADLGLIEDKLERAVRDAYASHLLQDSKSRRLVLVVPSVLPHPVLSVVFSTFFRNFQIPSITLLPNALLSLVSAGQRSGMVIDIGWHETVVTTVYELREIGFERTARAMRAVTLAMAELIEQAIAGSSPVKLGDKTEEGGELKYDFRRAEEATSRFAWCWPSSAKLDQAGDMSQIEQRLQSLTVSAEDSANALRKQDLQSMVTLPTISAADQPATATFEDLALPVEHALFASSSSQREQDDNEQVIPYLIYTVLATLSTDVRSACMSNLVITGGGSNVPGVKSRIMDDVRCLIEARGWDLIWGRASEKRREKLRELDLNRTNGTPPVLLKVPRDEDLEGSDEAAIPAGLAEQESDPIQDKLRQTGAKDKVEPLSGALRCVETLGSWAGASIVASLRLKGVVEIERDMYLQHGLAGARKETEVNVAKSRQSVGAGLARTTAGDGSAWTLGPWS